MSILYNYFKTYFWQISFILFLLSSISIVSGALIIDYVYGFDPCILCIYERIPYVFIFIISSSALLLNGKYRFLFLQLLTFTCIVGAGVAIYHSGVELGWWQPTSHCTPNINFSEKDNLNDFLSQLDNAHIGDCTRPAITILGLSLAEYNVIINFLYIAILIHLIRYNAKTNIQ